VNRSFSASLLGAMIVLAGVARSAEPFNKKSDRDELATAMILGELRSKGYSGDSIKLDLKHPTSVVMTLYKVTGGKAFAVQKSVATAASTSFEIGYLFRPNGSGERELSFIFDDHIVQTKSIGTHLRNVGGKSHSLPLKMDFQNYAIGLVKFDGEALIYQAPIGGREVEQFTTVEAAATKLKGGYFMTATLTRFKEGEE